MVCKEKGKKTGEKGSRKAFSKYQVDLIETTKRTF